MEILVRATNDCPLCQLKVEWWLETARPLLELLKSYVRTSPLLFKEFP